MSVYPLNQALFIIITILLLLRWDSESGVSPHFFCCIIQTWTCGPCRELVVQLSP